LPGEDAEHGWAWGGSALTYNPEGDPEGRVDGVPGSLFGAGHDHHQWVGEVSIPAPSPGRQLDDLPRASTLQPFTDIRGGLIDFPGFEMPRVAIEYLDGRLFFAWGRHLEPDAPGYTHGWATPALGSERPRGPWRVDGVSPYAVGDYLFAVDPVWGEAHLGGGSHLATGRFRDGGWGGMGPSLHAYRVPPDAAPYTALPSVALIQYHSSEGAGAASLHGYHHSDEWTGGAWLRPGDSSAVVIIGTKGIGDCWYGFENGVVWPEGGPHPPVPPPPFDTRGWWSSRFEAQILFYDPSDLAAVAAGRLAPYEPQPFAVLPIEDVLLAERRPSMKGRTGGVAYDPGNGYLFVLEPFADGERPVVHVWSVPPAG